MESLIQLFMDRYLSRREIAHCLPVSVPLAEFWTSLQEERRRRSKLLPLVDRHGNPFWFVVNSSIERQCDRVAELARRNLRVDAPDFEEMLGDAVQDEATASGMIEAAFASCKALADRLRTPETPDGPSEIVVRNNCSALNYVLSHLDEPLTAEVIVDIAKIVTCDMTEAPVTGFREEDVVLTDPVEAVYAPPEAGQVPEMMDALVRFIQESELHPVLKVCIAHFYFVYMHPFSDGNGRTARVLSYMLLLQSGYGFFRYFAISSLMANECGRYCKSILNVEEFDGDMTYFIDFYSAILARGVAQIEDYLTHHVFVHQKIRELEQIGALNRRQLTGVKRLLEGDSDRVSVDSWRKRYKITTETARRDLLELAEHGILTRQMEGRRAIFSIVR